MGEDTRQIEREIRDERADLDRNLRELHRQTRDLTDWRTHYRNHSGAFLAAAIGGGLILGALTAPRRASTRTSRPQVEPHHADWQPVGQRSGQSRSLQALKALRENPRARQQVNDTWQQILDTLIAIGSAKVTELLGSYVPGFRKEYESRHKQEEPASQPSMSHV